MSERCDNICRRHAPARCNPVAQVFRGRQVCLERWVVAEVEEMPAPIRTVPQAIERTVVSATGLGTQKPTKAAQQTRLARTVGTAHLHQRAGWRVEVEVADDSVVAAIDEPVLDD